MDYQRLYDFRFRDVDQELRNRVWQEIGAWMYERLERPDRVLDPACGRCEFINAIPAGERWAVDEVDYSQSWAAPGTTFVKANALEVELPGQHFDAVFVSNFLEHLHSQEQVAEFLEHMYAGVRPGGLIAIMGPNFRYCSKDYFDMADHTVILTHRGVEEHLYAAGFDIHSTAPQFLPYSFTGRLPAGPRLVKAYLKVPLAWRLAGKQFLVIGRRPR